MNLIERAKNILMTPKTEWEVIKTEPATPSGIFTGYVLPLALIPIAVAFISGMMWFGVMYGLTAAITAIITAAIGFFLGTYVTDGLAPSFGSTKNLSKSAQLVGYSYTASAVASILGFIPGIGLIASLAGFIYSAYLMYLGVGPLKDTPEDKRAIYVVVIILVQFAIAVVIGFILASIIVTGNRLAA